jgi:hypothetical protein
MKPGKTHDELVKNFSQTSSPPNDFAGAAEGGAGAFSTFPASQPTRETDFREIVERTTREYVAPPSRLPITMTQAESKEWNCNFQSQTPWDVEEGETGPMLAGTQMTTSATPVDRSTEDAFSALRRRGGGY